MRILFLTQLFNPEPNHLKGLSFAKALVDLGHEVEVLACYPNYPGGKIYPDYRQRLYMRENIDGIPIIRVPLYPSHDDSGLRRIACYSSFALSAATIGASLVKRADVVHVYQGPASLALPAFVLRYLRGIPFIYDIQDIWPDCIAASGMLNNRHILNAVNRWCNAAYKAASRIVVLSPGFKDALISRGVPSEKVEVIYNWCEENQASPATRDEEFRKYLGFSGRFVVLYAGTMGGVQSLDTVLEAAVRLEKQNPTVLFAFMGGGVEKERLRAKASALSNVRFLPRQPVTEVGRYFAAADALLIHLKRDPLFRITIPQKTQAYMAAGRPIIIGVEGNAADLIANANAGISCQPENPESIANAINAMAHLPTAEREQMGMNGLKFYYDRLCFKVGIRKYDQLFRSSIESPHTIL